MGRGKRPARTVDGARRCALYRYFCASGHLLYVGVSVSPVRRLQEHQEDESWAREIATVTIEWHGSRSAATAAENRAIASEGPRHNIAGAGASPVNWGPLLAAAIDEICSRQAEVLDLGNRAAYGHERPRAYSLAETFARRQAEESA